MIRIWLKMPINLELGKNVIKVGVLKELNLYNKEKFFKNSFCTCNSRNIRMTPAMVSPQVIAISDLCQRNHWSILQHFAAEVQSCLK